MHCTVSRACIYRTSVCWSIFRKQLMAGECSDRTYAGSGGIGIALVVAMVISGAVGTCIPLFFKKINVDPAVASGPLITTINDLVAVVTYYGLSWIFLIEMLHLAG